MVSTLVVEWIEIKVILLTKLVICLSPPSWWSGLKSGQISMFGAGLWSPPSWWSGLKYPHSDYMPHQGRLHPRGGVD